MKFKTEFQVLKLKDIVPPPYNPREDIVKGSDEYESLRRSLEQHGMVEPPVVNIHNMRCIGGNQRITVLRDMGVEEVLCYIPAGTPEPDGCCLPVLLQICSRSTTPARQTERAFISARINAAATSWSILTSVMKIKLLPIFSFSAILGRAKVS